jgi:aryl-alcohol dehydrogenase-like predicted oxidoreductase
MEETLIPGTAMLSSRVALGTWAIGGWMWGGSDEADAVKTIRAALDLGITLIDTAPVYGFGRSEELVGRAIAEHGGRERVLIATKAGLEWRDGQVFRNASARRIRAEIEDSLRRLRTTYVDIYQVHWPDPLAPLEESAEALRRLFEQGTIRAIGVSNFSPEQMDAFSAVAPLHVVQPPYNLFERQIEKDVLPYAEEHELAVLAYGALCRGLLSGRMRPDTGFDGDDLRQTDPKFQPPHYAQYLSAVAALDQLARERYGKSVLALAVRWILDQGPTIALWGARRPDQLARVEDALGWHLDRETRRLIDRILTETISDPVGPEFMAPPPRAERPPGRRRRGPTPALAARAQR